MLEIVVENKVGLIEFNNEELKKELEIELKKYDVVVTKDSIKEAKSLKAKLNKVKSLIDDERKRIKKEYCIPLVDFESKVKELTLMLENGYKKINNQVAEFELEELRIKKEKVKEKYSFIEMPIEIDFERIWEPSYENKGMDENKILESVQIKINKIVQDLDFIKSFTSEFSEVEKMQVEDIYKKTLDIGIAKLEVDKINNFKKQLEEREAEKEKEKQQVEEKELSPVEERVEFAQEMVEEVEELLTRTFQVTTTRENVIALGDFMKNKGIKFRKVEM